MAYTAVNVTKISAAGYRVDNVGTAGVAGGAGTGHKFSNDGHVFVHVHNTSTNAPNAVFLASGTFKGEALTVANETVAMASGVDKICGPFNPDLFNDADGNVNIYYTGSNEDELKINPLRL